LKASFDGVFSVIRVNNKDKNNQEEPDHTNLTTSQVKGVKLSSIKSKKVPNSPDQTTSQTNDKITESTSANEHKTLLPKALPLKLMANH